MIYIFSATLAADNVLLKITTQSYHLSAKNQVFFQCCVIFLLRQKINNDIFVYNAQHFLFLRTKINTSCWFVGLFI